jgi:hypothetical protein
MAPHPAHVVADATETYVDRHHLGMSTHDTYRYTRNVEHVFRENRREGVRRRR